MPIAAVTAFFALHLFINIVIQAATAGKSIATIIILFYNDYWVTGGILMQRWVFHQRRHLRRSDIGRGSLLIVLELFVWRHGLERIGRRVLWHVGRHLLHILRVVKTGGLPLVADCHLLVMRVQRLLYWRLREFLHRRSILGGRDGIHLERLLILPKASWKLVVLDVRNIEGFLHFVVIDLRLQPFVLHFCLHFLRLNSYLTDGFLRSCTFLRGLVIDEVVEVLYLAKLLAHLMLELLWHESLLRQLLSDVVQVALDEHLAANVGGWRFTQLFGWWKHAQVFHFIKGIKFQLNNVGIKRFNTFYWH